jgi:prepilin-type processing-associated H-X9-DG protein
MTANWSGAVAHYAGVNYYTEWQYNNIAWPEIGYISLYSTARNTARRTILQCPSQNYINLWGTRLAVSYGKNAGAYGLGENDSYTYDYTGAYPQMYGRVRDEWVVLPAATVCTADYANTDWTYYEYLNYQVAGPGLAFGQHDGYANVLWTDGHVTRSLPTSLKTSDFDRRK